MLKDVVDAFELRMLYEIQALVKQNPAYYGTISTIINEIEKPKLYRVNIEFCNEIPDYKVFQDVTKVWIRDNYLYLEKGDKTMGYNLNKVLRYTVVEYKEDTV